MKNAIPRIINTPYNQALDLLLDQKGSLQALITKIQSYEGMSEIVKTLQRSIDVIGYSIEYIKDLEAMVDGNDKLKTRLMIAEKHCTYLHDRLQQYIIVEQLILAENLQKTVETVQTKIEMSRSENQ